MLFSFYCLIGQHKKNQIKLVLSLAKKLYSNLHSLPGVSKTNFISFISRNVLADWLSTIDLLLLSPYLARTGVPLSSSPDSQFPSVLTNQCIHLPSVQWNDFSEDNSVADYHSFYITFVKRLANWPLAALIFIVFFWFDSQIHRIFVRFCFHRFPTLSSVPRKR